MSDISEYEQIFDYLSTPELPTEAVPALVFGRHDDSLVAAMHEIDDRGLATDYVVSGSFGKDSGELWRTRQPESSYIADIATRRYGIEPGRIHLEQKALVGSENARFGLSVMRELGLPMSEVTAVAHATSLRRLAATAVKEAANAGLETHKVYKAPTDYAFNAANPTDQRESAGELLRVVDWAAAGHIALQTEKPDEDLVQFAREKADTPAFPSPFALAVLRRMPHVIRHRIMTR